MRGDTPSPSPTEYGRCERLAPPFQRGHEELVHRVNTGECIGARKTVNQKLQRCQRTSLTLEYVSVMSRSREPWKTVLLIDLEGVETGCDLCKTALDSGPRVTAETARSPRPRAR